MSFHINRQPRILQHSCTSLNAVDEIKGLRGLSSQPNKHNLFPNNDLKHWRPPAQPQSTMGLFSYFQKLYDLDTLDTRFTTQSSASYRTVVESRGDDFGSRDAAKARVASKAGPSRWKTPEFLFYAVFVAFCIPYMCWIPYTVSRRMHPPPRLGYESMDQILTRSLKPLHPNSTSMSPT